jgi:hypothetical protein
LDKQEEKVITKIFCLYKQKRLLKEYEIKITCYSLKYLDKLVIIEEKEKKKYKEKIKQET